MRIGERLASPLPSPQSKGKAAPMDAKGYSQSNRPLDPSNHGVGKLHLIPEYLDHAHDVAQFALGAWLRP